MIPEKKDIDAMRDLMKILNEDTGSNDSYDSIPQQRAISKDTDVDAMKEILEAFSSATSNTVTALSETRPEMLAVERINNRVVFDKKFEIIISENKRYTVIDQNRTVVAEDLTLYESALGIVRKLNEGCSYLHPAIRKIVALEERYASSRNEARMLKENYQKAKGPKADILAAKYQSARDIAVEAKNLIKMLANK